MEYHHFIHAIMVGRNADNFSSMGKNGILDIHSEAVQGILSYFLFFDLEGGP